MSFEAALVVSMATSLRVGVKVRRNRLIYGSGAHFTTALYLSMIDGNVYIWHRDTGTLLEVLSGHGAGSVNSVAWNPRNPRVFATCSDDHTIRIWDATPSDEPGSLVNRTEYPGWEHEIGKGKGKSRERWEGDAAGDGHGLGSSSTSF